MSNMHDPISSKSIDELDKVIAEFTPKLIKANKSTTP